MPESFKNRNISQQEKDSQNVQRQITTGELIKGGADTEYDEKGNIAKLSPSDEQKAQMQMEQREGITENLREYIPLNKTVELTADETPEELKFAKPGSIWKLGTAAHQYTDQYYFIDREGNLAIFKLDAERVKSFAGKTDNNIEGFVLKELSDLGFTFISADSRMDWRLAKAVDQARTAKKEKLQQQKKEGFAF